MNVVVSVLISLFWISVNILWIGLLLWLIWRFSKKHYTLRLMIFSGLWVFLLVVFVSAIVYLSAYLRYKDAIFSADEYDGDIGTAIVFGAGVYSDGSVTPVLEDRLDTVYNLYEDDKIDKILVSGSPYETSIMRAYLMQQGCNQDDIMIDPQGLRTIDTCVNAYNKFNIHSAVLVSQRYHLPRAMYLCSSVGIHDVTGVNASRRYYISWWFWMLRELVALDWAIWEAQIKYGY